MRTVPTVRRAGHHVVSGKGYGYTEKEWYHEVCRRVSLEIRCFLFFTNVLNFVMNLQEI